MHVVSSNPVLSLVQEYAIPGDFVAFFGVFDVDSLFVLYLTCVSDCLSASQQYFRPVCPFARADTT
jgi:hypothetical protein